MTLCVVVLDVVFDFDALSGCCDYTSRIVRLVQVSGELVQCCVRCFVERHSVATVHTRNESRKTCSVCSYTQYTRYRKVVHFADVSTTDSSAKKRRIYSSKIVI